MNHQSRGMVLMMALIMLSMLGMTAASALRSASISISDVAWASDWERVDQAVSQVLRDHLRTLADGDPIVGTEHIATNPAVAMVRQTVALIAPAPSENRPSIGTGAHPAYQCHEISVTGERLGLRLTQQVVHCRNQDDTRDAFSSWRAITP